MSLILIDKPEGPTSHAVVSMVKRVLAAEKVGHLGTLDPFASGLLPVMIGNTARLADEAMNGEKGYLFSIALGHETDTLDPTGRVVAEAPLPSHLIPMNIEAVLEKFRGQIEQTPPAYSALKMNGMPLYEHMRATGKLPIDIESKRRTVTIHSLSLVDYTSSSVVLRVICSKGTYVRCLARDIAKELGSVGTCQTLRREWVEPWHVNNALKVELDPSGRIAPAAIEVLEKACLPAWSVAPKLPRAILSADHKMKFVSGNPIELPIFELQWSTEHAQKNAPLKLEDGTQNKAIIHCEEILYLCELQKSSEDRIKIQPRKRIA